MDVGDVEGQVWVGKKVDGRRWGKRRPGLVGGKEPSKVGAIQGWRGPRSIHVTTGGSVRTLKPRQTPPTSSLRSSLHQLESPSPSLFIVCFFFLLPHRCCTLVFKHLLCPFVQSVSIHLVPLTTTRFDPTSFVKLPCPCPSAAPAPSDNHRHPSILIQPMMRNDGLRPQFE